MTNYSDRTDDVSVGEVVGKMISGAVTLLFWVLAVFIAWQLFLEVVNAAREVCLEDLQRCWAQIHYHNAR